VLRRLRAGPHRTIALLGTTTVTAAGVALGTFLLHMHTTSGLI
jgi:hypothetical protein